MGNLFDNENEKIKKQTDELLDTIERYQTVLKKSTFEVLEPIKEATKDLTYIKNETWRLKEDMEKERNNMHYLINNLKIYKSAKNVLYVLLTVFLVLFLYLKYQDNQIMKQNSQNIQETADLYQKMYLMMTGEVKNYWDKENGKMYLLSREEYEKKIKEKKK